MSMFKNKITVSYLSEQNLWQLEDKLIYNKNEKEIVVPKSFLTDFASVPWPASMFIPKIGKTNGAAVVHDWIYFMSRVKYLLDSGRYNEATIVKEVPILKRVNLSTFTFMSRKEADEIFLTAMKDIGVNLFKRLTMYRAVRTFAWLAWGKRGRIIGYDSKKGIMRLV